MYLVSKVCNTIKEFKYRFENNQIVEYDIVHPSYILKVQEDAFNFCTVPFTLDFNTFYECLTLIAFVKSNGKIIWQIALP